MDPSPLASLVCPGQLCNLIDLDASLWTTPLDFLKALRVAIDAPDGHGLNLNAFIDSMIWGGINRLEPPYTVRILHSAKAPPEVREYIDLLANYIAEARGERQRRLGIDTEVAIEVEL